jgi:hypothetical protein
LLYRVLSPFNPTPVPYSIELYTIVPIARAIAQRNQIMASFSGRLSRPFIFVVIACVLLVILGSSAAPSYGLIHKDTSPKEIYNIVKDTIFDGADVTFFHHRRSSRWKHHVRYICCGPLQIDCDASLLRLHLQQIRHATGPTAAQSQSLLHNRHRTPSNVHILTLMVQTRW